MKSLKQLLNQRLKPIPRWLPYFLTALPLLGFIDSVYLTTSRLLNFSVPCTIFKGCDVVTKSTYSSIGPIPVAMLGIFYYLILFIIAIYYLDTAKKDVFYLFGKLSWIGAVFSVWLVFLQIFILEAYCTYCMISASFCAILFVLCLVYIRVDKE